MLFKNNRDLGVKNGMLGTVEAVEPDALHIRLDGSGGAKKCGRAVSIPVKEARLLPEVLAVDDVDWKGIHVEPIKTSKIHRDFTP